MDDPQKPVHTRLLAVLAADAVGYSRLIALDDHGTVAALDAAREVFRAGVAAHDGRVVDTAGDSILAAFGTATAAVQTALATQAQLLAEAADSDAESRLRFRVGVHVGDVIEKADGSIYGDGVNIAARLQALAEPDGVVVSQAVLDIVARRVACSFIDLGEQTVKSISQPLRVYQLALAAPATAQVRAEAVQGLRAGPLTLDLPSRTASLDNQTLALDNLEFDLLRVLTLRDGQVLSRHELLEQVWPGMPVGIQPLQALVEKLRALLGAGAIVTVPGRGYRLALGDARKPAHTPNHAPQTQSSANLPTPTVGMVGRDDDLAALERLLQQHRLVTVVGAGGMGKTTLALAAAHDASSRGATAWVELAPLQDPALLPGRVGQALGVAVAGNNPQQALVKALAAQDLLLVLDNAEHLLEAVAALAQALHDGAPGIRLLVTSQAALKVDGERQFRLGALAAPESNISVDEALTYGAVALFVDQAQAADRHFRLNADNLASVVDLCVHLDGVALAIKLAAARLPLFGLKGLQQRLTERFRLLGQGPRSAPQRQQTLRAALDWSHGLLAPNEQRVLRRLGVFGAGFALEQAAKTAGDEALDEWAVVEALGALVDRSMVMIDAQHEGQYRLLESAREYAAAKLREAGEHARTHERAARVLQANFPALAEAQPQTLAYHLTEGDCLDEAVAQWERAAAQAMARSASVEAVLHLSMAIELTRTLAERAVDPAPLLRRELALQLRLGPLVMMTKGLGSPDSEAHYQRALHLCESVGSLSDSFIATFNLWFIAEAQLKFDQAQIHIESSLRLAEQAGDERFMVQARHAGYTTAINTGKFAKALSEAQDGYRRYRAVDGPYHRATFAGHDPGICALGHQVTANLLLGNTTLAFEQLDLLEQQIRACDHAASQIIGRYSACAACVFARTPQRMRALAEEGLVVCRRLSLAQYEGLFTVLSAWAAAWLDGDRGAPAQLAAGVERFESTGTRLRVSLLRAIAADGCAAVGDVGAGLVLVERGLRELIERQELGWHAYALIVRGELLGQQGRSAEAEASFAQARVVAQGQSALLMELRAANGLARLWRHGAQANDIEPLLQGLLQRFTPMANMRDLDEARALLKAARTR